MLTWSTWVLSQVLGLALGSLIFAVAWRRRGQP